ncbi:hypothetical protein EOD23_30975 [Mesorhizobium sp. USDA-HM6]|nr:hypothetical protein EOD23_30975 [Mesorhizobium sp. USDA-HM6]
MQAEFPPTPLWPAGHLPRKGGDQMSLRLSPIPDAARGAPALTQPISPLAGEMSGRTEGGASRQRWPLAFSVLRERLQISHHPSCHRRQNTQLVPSFSGKLALAGETERRRLRPVTLG